MVVESKSLPGWARALATPAREFAPTDLPVRAGRVPSGLRGSLYRNGPGRLERGGERVGHWFDGDGAILAVHFGGGRAQGVYRFVHTAGFEEEERAGRLLWGNYGMVAPGLIERWTKQVKNAANTSVLALDDRLLALWEGGLPHALDPTTLETRGLDRLAPEPPPSPFSAHPKIDPETGEIFNFGVAAGLTTRLQLYVLKGDGRVRRRGAVALDGLPLVHDCALAGRYLVFCVPPVRIQPIPVALGLTSFADAMVWQPRLGTQILIVDRETLRLVSRSETEPWYQWHFANGYEDTDGSLVIDLCRYPDFATNQYLREVAKGETHTATSAQLWRLRIEPTSGRILANEVLLDRSCEFPTVAAATVGRHTEAIFLALHRRGSEIGRDYLNSLARFDPRTGRLSEADLGEGRTPSEPLCVADAEDPARAWVLTVVYDSAAHTSEVWIFDAEHLEESPVCRLGLPAVIPHGFHGTWRSARG